MPAVAPTKIWPSSVADAPSSILSLLEIQSAHDSASSTATTQSGMLESGARLLLCRSAGTRSRSKRFEVRGEFLTPHHDAS